MPEIEIIRFSKAFSETLKHGYFSMKFDSGKQRVLNNNEATSRMPVDVPFIVLLFLLFTMEIQIDLTSKRPLVAKEELRIDLYTYPIG